MNPAILMGLLNPQQSLAPSLGLLGLSGGGLSPIQAALAALAAQKQGQKGAGANPTTAQPVPRPQVQGAPVPEAPPAAPVSSILPPPSIAGRPPLSPARAGLLAGGVAALEASPGSAYTGPAPVLAAALKAGIPAYLGGKEQEAARAQAQQQDAAYADALQDPALVKRIGPAAIRALQAMPAAVGLPLLQKFLEKETKVGKDEVVVDAGGNVVAAGPKSTTTFKPGDWVQGEDGTLTQIPVDGNLLPERDLATAAVLVGVDPNDRRNWTPEQRQAVGEMLQRLNAAKRPAGTTVNLPSPARELEASTAAILTEERGKVAGAAQTLPLIDRGLKLLDEGIKAGTAAKARVWIGNALNTVGASDDETVRNTQEFLANAAEIILPITKALGSGSGFSNTDREFLYQAKAGKISDDPKALRNILLAMQRGARASLDLYRKRADKITAGLSPATVEAFKIEVPEPESSAPAGGGANDWLDQRPDETLEAWSQRIAKGPPKAP